MWILLNTIERVKTFIEDIKGIDESTDIDICKGRYVIDARSIMGIFSLDLSKPLLLIIHSDDEDELTLFNEIVKKYEVEE